jgi:vitamin-K-epoxide reductase (warfarin-sensitive)
LQFRQANSAITIDVFPSAANVGYIGVEVSGMRWAMVSLTLVGVVVASLALREHYRTDTSPCSINDRWDCGIVNHSPYAKLGGVPVAAIGIAGYLLLGTLAFKRAYRLMLVPVLIGLGFSLYLTRIETRILGVYCIYCVMSLGVISLLTLLVAERTVVGGRRDRTLTG